MKVKVYFYDLDDGSCWLRIDINGVKVLNVREGELGSNTLGRSFNDCVTVVDDIIKMAYEAGQNDGPDGKIKIEITNGDPDG